MVQAKISRGIQTGSAMEQTLDFTARREPWNKGKLVGQKASLRLKEIWAIRIRLQLQERTRELALFNLAVDSKLRSCDLVKLRVRDVRHGEHIARRAMVMQQKTQRPVQFEITEQTREPSPPACSFAFIDAPVRADRPPLGERDWSRPRCLWDPYAQAHKGFVDLPSDQESASRTAAARTFEAREHRSIPRD